MIAILPSGKTGIDFPLRIDIAGDLEPVSYELAVDIDPSGGAIEVAGEIVVRRSPFDTDPIELRLHDAFTVRELQVNGRSTRHTFEAGSASRLQPTAQTLVVEAEACRVYTFTHSAGGSIENVQMYKHGTLSHSHNTGIPLAQVDRKSDCQRSGRGP